MISWNLMRRNWVKTKKHDAEKLVLFVTTSLLNSHIGIVVVVFRIWGFKNENGLLVEAESLVVGGERVFRYRERNIEGTDWETWRVER